MSLIYVTGHRNPDTDSIAASVGYAELLRRLNPNDEYVAVRLGDVNSQTRWVLQEAGADEPELLRHILLRARDVMQEEFCLVAHHESVRDVGITMARRDLDLVPIVDDDGVLAGVMTERALARRYIRESREASSLVDAPTSVDEIVQALGGELLVGDVDATVAGRVWVSAMDARWPETGIAEGDVVVIGNRDDAQRHVIEIGVSLLVVSNDVTPPDEVLELARERGTTVVRSPLDSYVSGRMITLAAPCSSLMDGEPLTVAPDDVLADITDAIKEVHYRAAIVTDRSRRPIGLIARTDLVSPEPRKVVLVDHAEQGQSVPGIEEAEIVEILDHHHIGSIETRIPVRATFDPVGSTATLVIERFRQNGMEPHRRTATLLLGAVLSDTVILNSPTTTDRDRAVVDYLERVLRVDAREFGRSMFENGSDVADVPADEIAARDAKEYSVDGGTISIAQIETVGDTLLERRDELLQATRDYREDRGHLLSALMVTDILSKGTHLLVAGEAAPVERAFGEAPREGVVELPGVMSRKKQVAPKLMGAF